MTDTKQAHTGLPFDRPWIVNPFIAQIDSSRVDEYGDLVPVCQMLWPTDLRSEEETQRFAAFIVRACNSHYLLTEALREVLELHIAHHNNPAHARARAALSQAGGAND